MLYQLSYRRVFEYKVGIEPTPLILQTNRPPRSTYTFVSPTGLEPVTPSLKVRCSNLLSYEFLFNVEPNGIEPFPLDFQSNVRTSYTKAPIGGSSRTRTYEPEGVDLQSTAIAAMRYSQLL